MKLEMKKDVIYRCIGTEFTNGIIACGFMTKPTHEQSQYNFVINYYSCFLLLSGSGFYYTKDNVKIPIHAGNFVQRIPGDYHSTEIIPDGNWLEFFISFGRTTYDYLRSLSLLPTDSPVKKVIYDDSTIQMFSRLLQHLKEAEDVELPYMSLKAQEVVLSTLHHIQKGSPEDALKESMEEACRLLSSKVNTTISLKDVANTINMSYENFRKQFRKFTGTSPAQYRIEQKMKHAKLMLLSGISIKETSMLTGYSDTYSFTKQFTHSVGISPGRYKDK
ncbi:AraC family transcriptional regulator [Clostridium beijerinckii NRRL B-598]|nr:AraC family transcriptional regulator [Clostridium beijerinckii NRRL B-598]